MSGSPCSHAHGMRDRWLLRVMDPASTTVAGRELPPADDLVQKQEYFLVNEPDGAIVQSPYLFGVSSDHPDPDSSTEPLTTLTSTRASTATSDSVLVPTRRRSFAAVARERLGRGMSSDTWPGSTTDVRRRRSQTRQYSSDRPACLRQERAGSPTVDRGRARLPSDTRTRSAQGGLPTRGEPSSDISPNGRCAGSNRTQGQVVADRRKHHDEEDPGGLHRRTVSPPLRRLVREASESKSPEPPSPRAQGVASEELPRRAFLQRGNGKSVSGAPMHTFAQPAGSKKSGLLPFLRGTGVDASGRSLDDILCWTFDKLESVHDYIQWLFPTDESSRWNAGAPLLTRRLQQVVREDPVARANIRKCFCKFLLFLGLEVLQKDNDCSGGPNIVVQKAPHFESRVSTCWKSSFMRMGGNHNWLRISRVLHCLRLVGLDQEAAALHACLEMLYAQGLPCGSAIDHWRKNALGTLVE